MERSRKLPETDVAGHPGRSPRRSCKVCWLAFPQQGYLVRKPLEVHREPHIAASQPSRVFVERFSNFTKNSRNPKSAQATQMLSAEGASQKLLGKFMWYDLTVAECRSCRLCRWRLKMCCSQHGVVPSIADCCVPCDHICDE